jgi:hypothetical protein
LIKGVEKKALPYSNILSLENLEPQMKLPLEDLVRANAEIHGEDDWPAVKSVCLERPCE